MLWRSRICICRLVVGLCVTANVLLADESAAPPAPESALPAVPQSECPGTCRLLSSDAFAEGSVPERLPECHPLPEIAPPHHLGQLFIFEDASAPTRLILAAPGPPVRTWAEATGVKPNPPVDLRQHRFLRSDVQYIAPAAHPTQTACNEPAPGSTPTDEDTRAEGLGAMTPVQHLNRAAEHLEAAGRHDEATHIRQQAEAMQRHARQRLQELREQQQHIEQEIQQLEKLSGSIDQVRIRVSILEVDEQKLKQLGITFTVPAGPKTLGGMPLPSPLHTSGYELRPAKVAALQIQALKNSGAAKVLAEPVLVTQGGREGTLFSGGEFPILIPLPDGTIEVRHEECGVRLEATPHLLADGRVRLELASCIAERDFRGARTSLGIKTPSITKRRINTQATMRFGQTLVIGGLANAASAAAECGRVVLRAEQDAVQLVSDSASEPSGGTSLLVFVTPEPAGAAPRPPVR